MKKLLSVLGVVGLVATTSANVVACGPKATDPNVVTIDGHDDVLNISWTVKNDAVKTFDFYQEMAALDSEEESMAQALEINNSTALAFWNASDIESFVNVIESAGQSKELYVNDLSTEVVDYFDKVDKTKSIDKYLVDYFEIDIKDQDREEVTGKTIDNTLIEKANKIDAEFEKPGDVVMKYWDEENDNFDKTKEPQMLIELWK
jgi:hypothetical protein